MIKVFMHIMSNTLTNEYPQYQNIKETYNG